MSARKKMGLPLQMGIGMVLGILVGTLAPKLGISAAFFKPFGDLFINLVRMVVVPLVLATLVSGAASVGDVGRLGRVAAKTLVFYFATTALAVAIGPSHGAYKFKGEAKLDFERLEEIGKRLPNYPLVLHGASSVPQEFVEACNKFGGQVGGARGVPEDMLRKAAGMGVCKINVDTDIRLAVTASIRQYLVEHPEAFDPRAYLKPARQAVKDMVAHKIRNVMGSSGKA